MLCVKTHPSPHLLCKFSPSRSETNAVGWPKSSFCFKVKIKGTFFIFIKNLIEQHLHCFVPLSWISCSVMPSSLRPHGLQPMRLLYPWDFPGKNTGVVCHFLCSTIFCRFSSNFIVPPFPNILSFWAKIFLSFFQVPFTVFQETELCVFFFSIKRIS